MGRNPRQPSPGPQPQYQRRSPGPVTPSVSSNGFSDGSPPMDDPPNSDGPSKPLYLCNPFVKAALVKGNFKTIVVLPKYVDVMEWVAVNSASFRVLFFCHVNNANIDLHPQYLISTLT